MKFEEGVLESIDGGTDQGDPPDPPNNPNDPGDGNGDD